MEEKLLQNQLNKKGINIWLISIVIEIIMHNTINWPKIHTIIAANSALIIILLWAKIKQINS